ncbi:HSF-type DNA-binding [Achlya hypogyna]|uniref:HSF-type DNA-binding n=1 Tax=Achlya hypogyna TaxID=1202772 RepID=A0A1V9YLH0_ACHHY|nr:HSF-type DNA-binding [Achlya hypogyna]
MCSFDSEVPRSKHNTPIFLLKTYEMLERCPSSVAGWSSSGTSFVVRSKSEFETKVLPVYFKHRNFHSFVRQLNIYGFKKVRVETEADSKPSWEFLHPKFRRGSKRELNDIHRRTITQDALPTPSGPEVDQLRLKIKHMQQHLAHLHASIERVSSLVTQKKEYQRLRRRQLSLQVTPACSAPAPEGIEAFLSQVDWSFD